MLRDLLLTPVVWLSVFMITASAPASDRGKDKEPSRSTPSERLEQLLHILKNDRQEERRSKAASELGTFPSQEFPEIVPALIDALVRDESSSVRKTLVKTLADIEPATHEVKDALDQAVKQDKTWSVRQVARLAAWRYKPKDEPINVPGPRTRNTSKPNNSGSINTKDKKAQSKPAADPLKDTKTPVPVVPSQQVPIPPPIAPGPGKPPETIPAIVDGVPTMLSAPRPK